MRLTASFAFVFIMGLFVEHWAIPVANAQFREVKRKASGSPPRARAAESHIPKPVARSPKP